MRTLSTAPSPRLDPGDDVDVGGEYTMRCWPMRQDGSEMPWVPTLPMDGPNHDRELTNGKVLDRGSGEVGYVSPPHPSSSPLALSPLLTRTCKQICYLQKGLLSLHSHVSLSC